MAKKNKSKAGRAAAKQKAKKVTNPAGGSGRQHASLMARFAAGQMIDDDEDDDMPAFRGFSHSTPTTSTSKYNKFSPSIQYRHQTVSFVSAGVSTPALAEDSEDSEEEDEDEDIDDSSILTNIVPPLNIHNSEKAMADMHIHGEDTKMTGTTAEEGESNRPLFVVDTEGDSTLMSGVEGTHRPVRLRAPSASSSGSSSEERIVFTGRNNAGKGKKPVATSKAPAVQKPVKQEVKPVPQQTLQQVPTQAPKPEPKYKRAQSHTFERTTKRYRWKETIIVPASGPEPLQDTAQGVSQKLPQGATQEPSQSTSTPQNLPQDATQDTPQDAPLGAPEAAAQDGPQATAGDAERKEDIKETSQGSFSGASGAHTASTEPTSVPVDHDPLRDGFKAYGWASRPSEDDLAVNPDARWAPAPSTPYWKTTQPRADLNNFIEEASALEATPRTAKVTFVEPKAEETIDSLRADYKAAMRKQKDGKLAAREEDEIKLDGRSSSRKRSSRTRGVVEKRNLRRPIIDDEDDEDEVYEDYKQNILSQLDGADDGSLHSNIPTVPIGGPSLVVDGEEIGEDEVIPRSAYETMNNDDSDSEYDGPIGQDWSDMSSSELEDELEYTEKEQWEDEADLRKRRREAMTDEQYARLLAKQYEFGYDDEDLIIDDGEFADGIGDVQTARAGLANMGNSFFGRSLGPNRRTGVFPSASTLADTVDQYGADGFDIMDFDRPSLRPVKKGRKGKMPAEIEALSDEELRDSMSAAWDADRRKKSLRKAEREEHRAEGWLSPAGKQGKQDLSVKYADGMTKQEILTELRAFVVESDFQTRPFPPMDKDDRKLLHEVAQKLGLKSKSIGGGKGRFTTIIKTRKTLSNDMAVDRALETASRRLGGRGTFGRAQRGGIARGGGRFGAGGRGGGAGAATLKHGEIVGAAAPAIGKENFGHKLMMKMGWEAGKALGKEGEGRLTPVEQVVRSGRAGLG